MYAGAMNRLSASQKMELGQRLKRSRDVDERNRLCVILGYDEGASVGELASILRITRQTVYRYLDDFEIKQKLRNDPRGGRKAKLDNGQSMALKDHLSKVTYFTVKEICNYVKTAFGVSLSRSRMTAWLHENRFVFKCPKKIPGKLDPEKQKAFIEEYKALKARMRPDEELYFVDAVHPEHQSEATHGWILKGEQKTLQSTGKQLRLHFAGALCLSNMKIVSREYDTVDAEAMIDFFKTLEASTEASKIYVVMDNARSNKNRKLDEYLKTSRIEPWYLPPYSPNLNPIERLWKIMREVKIYNRYYESCVDFFHEIRSFFSEDISERAQRWSSRINDNFQVIELNPIQPVFC